MTVKDYAEQCMKRLDRVAQFGARKGNKKISSDEIAIAKVTLKDCWGYVCLRRGCGVVGRGFC